MAMTSVPLSGAGRGREGGRESEVREENGQRTDGQEQNARTWMEG